MKQILILACLSLSFTSFGQKLKFKVEGQKDTTVFLTKYVGSKLFYADTAVMKNGIVEFNAKSDLKPGVLALLLPNQKYFDFIFNKEEIQLETSTADFIANMKVKKSEENKIFMAYIQFLQKQRTVATGISKKRDGVKKDDPAYKKLGVELDSITKLVSAYQQNIITANPTKLVSKIVKMSIDIVVPDAPRNEKGQITDSNFRYLYYRNHFWDNIDLLDDRLVNVQVFGQKLEFYFGKTMLVQDPDSVLAVAIPFVEKLKKGSEMFRYCVDYITNSTAKSNIMGMDKVFVVIVDRYYCKNDEKGKSLAFWMPEEKLEDLCKDNKVKMNLVKGVRPPNISLRDTTDKNWKDFYSLKAEYTILYFWDPECGHCKKTTPKLETLYTQKFKARNIEVFAVGKATGEDFEKWKKFIKDNKLTFINVGLTESLFNAATENPLQFIPKFTTLESLNYHDTYDIYATPRVIVLDKDKKIIGKQLTMSQLEDFMDRLQGVKTGKIIPVDEEEEAN